MSNKTTFPLSGEDINLLGENQDFFKSIVEVYQKIKQEDNVELNLLAVAPDNKIEKTVFPDNSVEISFVFGLDNNEDVTDGKLFFKDTFVFDPKERLADFKREYNHNGKGNTKNWEKWMGIYQSNNPKPDQLRLEKFASLLARRYLGKAHWRTISTPLMDALQKQFEYLKKGVAPVSEFDKSLNVLFGDSQSHYSLDYQGEKVLLTLSFVVDDDDNPTNRRFYWNEKITFDYKTREFEKVERTFTVAPESQDIAGLKEQAEALTKKMQPSPLEGRQFFEELRPKLPLLDPERFEKVMDKASEPYRFRPGYASMAERISVRNSKLDKVRHDSTRHGLEVLEQVAMDELQKRYDEGRGLVTQIWSDSVNLGKEQGLIKSVFIKAKEKIDKEPGKSPFAVLKALDLNPQERVVADRLQGLHLGQELNSIAQEYDPRVRAHNYARFARERLMLDNGYANASFFVATMIKDHPNASKVAEEILSFGTGTASNGTKIQYLGNKMLDELSSPSMIGAMITAPFVGGALEFAALRVMGGGGKYFAGRWLASQIGLGGEAAAFSINHRFFASLSVNPDVAWKDFGLGEIGTAYLMFNGARMAHWGTGQIFKAKSPSPILGKDWVVPPQIPTAPGGRWITDFGAPARDLNWFGRSLEFTTQHTLGMSSMLMADLAATHIFHFKKPSKQGKMGDLFDVATMYGTAILGNHLGNRATGGKFQENLGKMRLGLEWAAKAPPPPATVPAAAPPAAPPPGPPPGSPPGHLALPSAPPPRGGPPPLPGASAKPPPAGPPPAAPAEGMFPHVDSEPPPSNPTKIRPLEEVEAEGLEIAKPRLEVIPDMEMLPYQFSLMGFEGGILNIDLAANTQRITFGRNMNEPSGLKVLGEIIQVNVSREHPTLSEFHAELLFGPDGELYFGDNGSAYGSRLNGKDVVPGKAHAVQLGDQIHLGEDISFIFNVEGPKSEALQTYLELQGNAFRYFAHHPEIKAPVEIGVYPLQNKPPPPDPATEFPFAQIFPGFKPKNGSDPHATRMEKPDASGTVPEASTKPKDYVVAYLRDAEGKAVRKFSSDQTTWPLFVKGTRGPYPIGNLSIDAKGRWAWQNFRGDKGAKVNGEITHQWDFVGDGVTIDWGEGPMRLEVPKHKQKTSTDDASTVTRAPETGLVESGKPDDAVAEWDDLAVTKTNIQIPRMPQIISPLPHSLRAGLPEGQGPIQLTQIVKGKMEKVSDPNAAIYFIRADASGKLYLSTESSSDNYGRIVYGDMKTDTSAVDRGWWIISETVEGGYDLKLNGRGLTAYQGEKLTWNSVITLIDSRSQEAMRIVFEKPPGAGERLKTEGMPVQTESAPAAPVDIPLMLAGLHPAPAAEFPREVYASLDPRVAPMSLRHGHKLELADRSNTVILLGSDPQAGVIAAPARPFRLGGSTKVAPDHAIVFVDIKGRWWVLDLGTEHGTYLNNHRLNPGEAKQLLDRDKISLGGLENVDSPFSADGSRTIRFEMPKEAREILDAQPAVPRVEAPPPEAKPEEYETVDDSEIVADESDFGDVMDSSAPKRAPSVPPDSDSGDRLTVGFETPVELLNASGDEPAPPTRAVRPLTIPPPPGDPVSNGAPVSSENLVTVVKEIPMPPDAYPTQVRRAPQADIHEAPTQRPPAGTELPDAAVPTPAGRPAKPTRSKMESPPPPPALPGHLRPKQPSMRPPAPPTRVDPEPVDPSDPISSLDPVSSSDAVLAALDPSKSQRPPAEPLPPPKPPVFDEKETPQIKARFEKYVRASLEEQTRHQLFGPDKKIIPGMTPVATLELDLGRVTSLGAYRGRLIEAKLLGKVQDGKIHWVTDSIKSKPTEADNADPRYNLVMQQLHRLGQHAIVVDIQAMTKPAPVPMAPSPADIAPKPVAKTLISEGIEPPTEPAAPPVEPQPLPPPAPVPVAPAPAKHKSGLVNALRPLFNTDPQAFENNLAVFDRANVIGEMTHQSDPADIMDFFYRFDEHNGEPYEHYSALLKLSGKNALRLKQNFQLGSDGNTILFLSKSFEAGDPPNTLALVQLASGSEPSVMEGIYSKLLSTEAPIGVLMPLKVDATRSPFLQVLYRASDAGKVHTALRELATHYPSILEGSIPLASTLKDPQGSPIHGIGLMELKPEDPFGPRKVQKYLLQQAFQATVAAYPEGNFNAGVLLRAAQEQFQENGLSAVFPGFSSEAVVGSHKPVVDDAGL